MAGTVPLWPGRCRALALEMPVIGPHTYCRAARKPPGKEQAPSIQPFDTVSENDHKFAVYDIADSAFLQPCVTVRIEKFGFCSAEPVLFPPEFAVVEVQLPGLGP